MEGHVTLLALLTRVWGALSVLVGVSMLFLATGALAELRSLPVSSLAVAAGVAGLTFLLLALCALAWGGVHLWTAGLMDRRSARGRTVMLALGVCNLVLLPFGTALGGYAIWVLLSPGTRRLFEHHVWTNSETPTNS